LKSRMIALVLCALAVTAMCGCTAKAIYLDEREITNGPKAAEGPDAIVSRFYDWYVDYVSGGSSGGRRNALVDGVYRDRSELSDEFKQRLEALLGGDEPVRADPFLLAQDVPQSIACGEAKVQGDAATVVVRCYWNPDTQYESEQTLAVTLERAGESWQITGVRKG